MYYVTETQLKQILAAIKALPVKADSFDAADIWVGLYLAAQNIASQPVEQLENKPAEEPCHESE